MWQRRYVGTMSTGTVARGRVPLTECAPGYPQRPLSRLVLAPVQLEGSTDSKQFACCSSHGDESLEEAFPFLSDFGGPLLVDAHCLALVSGELRYPPCEPPSLLQLLYA